MEKELQRVQVELAECQRLHEEEMQSLRDQQSCLKELLRKTQADFNQSLPAAQLPNLEVSHQQLEHLEWLRNQTEEAHLETERFRSELNEAQKKLKGLEQELLENKQHAQREVDHLQQLLEEQKLQGNELETVVSTTSSHYLRRELETIKRNLTQGNQETKALEARYIEILNEKIALEHQSKQMQIQLEHQSSNLISFQEQLHKAEKSNKILETSLEAKEAECVQNCKQQEELQNRLEYLNELTKEKEIIQDNYEELKEEWNQLSERLEEAINMRIQGDQHLVQLETIAANQETQLQEFAQQLQTLHQEKGSLESERDQFKNLLDESEARLKVAQQHLAKKVKEAALLSEKLEEQQIHLTDFAQTIEYQKTQAAQLQANVDLYQRQEKRLQDQLHEALKGTESQIVKWEEKYFRMYDKWQESENRIRELKKFEEKHLQMQSLLANLGNFMGSSHNSSNAIFQPSQDPPNALLRVLFLVRPL